MNAMHHARQGFLEEAIASNEENPTAKFVSLDQRIKEYREHLRLLHLPESLSQFVDGYVLAGIHPKGLHDEVILKASLRKSVANDKGQIDVTLGGTGARNRILRITYLDMKFASGADQAEGSSVIAHDIVEIESLFQHSIYTLGGNSIRIVFGDLRTEVLDE